MKHHLMTSIFSLVTIFLFFGVATTRAQVSPIDVINTVKTAKEVVEQIDDFVNEEDTLQQGDWDDTYRTSEEEGERSTQYSFDVNHPPEDAQRIGCICMDGTSMDLKGGGACAGYGGVRHWIYKKPNGEEVEYPTERHLQHPEPLSEEELANLSAHNKQEKYGNSYNGRGINRGLGWEELMAIIIICVTIAFITKTIWSNRREE